VKVTRSRRDDFTSEPLKRSEASVSQKATIATNHREPTSKNQRHFCQKTKTAALTHNKPNGTNTKENQHQGFITRKS
jgi:hypothetical protein